MKKLNNKGFTLVELLAVIIILAIVVGISIPAVTNIINNSKTQALGVATKTAVDFLQDQYAIYSTDVSIADKNFKNVLPNMMDECKILTTANSTDKSLITAMGFNAEQVYEVAVEVSSSTGKAYVEVIGIENTSDYYITAWSKSYKTNVNGKDKTYYSTTDSTVTKSKKAGTATKCKNPAPGEPANNYSSAVNKYE